MEYGKGKEIMYAFNKIEVELVQHLNLFKKVLLDIHVNFLESTLFYLFVDRICIYGKAA